jgi:hypothetical protein
MAGQNGEPREQHERVTCMNPECKQEFVVMIPPAEVINSATVSIVVWTHPEMQNCPHCGVPYQMSIRRLGGAELVWRPIQMQRRAGIVVPPPGFKLPIPPQGSQS